MVESLGVNWSSISYVTGDTIRAVINANDSTGAPMSGLSWVLLRNNVQFASGQNREISFQTSSPGVYRIRAQATDRSGTMLTGDSAVLVNGGFEIQASPEPPEVDPTVVYLGALYVSELTGAGGPTPTLPYVLASFTDWFTLLPGTTHVSFDLDPLQNAVDDEVIVRTPTGNWTLRNTLTTEDVGYDYRGGQPIIPAPLDGRLRLTVEAFNAQGVAASAFNFRVRVKCWRQGPALYRYDQCPFSRYPGGEGKRFRLFAALVTQLELQTDVESGLDRAETGTTTIEAQVPEVTNVPRMRLNTTGDPNIVNPATGVFFTDSNWFATYEPQGDDLPEFDAFAVAGVEGIRPFYMTLQQPAAPPLIQRIKRLKGKLVVYIAQGGLFEGSVLTARIETSKLYALGPYVEVSIPITETVFNNRNDVFVKAATVDIDLSDYQFSINGLVISFRVDESAAIVPDGCSWPPDAVWTEQPFYSPTKAAAALFDGACFTNPQPQESVDSEVGGHAQNLAGCHETICGPVGTYCYTSLNGSEFADFRQPLHFPAPVVAYGSNPLHCYRDPLLIGESAGTAYQEIFTRQNEALCGDGYQYDQCSGDASLLLVYPQNTVPHDVVHYGSECWSRSGGPVSGSIARNIIDNTDWPVVSVGSVTAVASCDDLVCNGSNPNGHSVRYIDTQTRMDVHVNFEGMDLGLPYIAASPQVADSGYTLLPTLDKLLVFTEAKVLLTAVANNGLLEIDLSALAGLPRRIVLQRGNEWFIFGLPPGQNTRVVQVSAGDAVYIDIGNHAGLLTDATRRKRARVQCRPVVVLPRLYHASEVAGVGSGTIRSVGFTGLTNRSPYTLFHTLPWDGEQEFPNPDNILTVQDGSGQELVLIRTRAIGDPIPPLPGNTEWYSGQTLNGSVTFRFYTSREEQGAHGELDVWFQSQASRFPTYFKMDEYRTLELKSGTPIRVSAQVGDTSRNALRMTDSGTQAAWPREYVADDGQRIVADVISISGTVYYDGKKFVTAGTDTGISKEILPATQVVNSDDVWITTQGDFWTSTQGELWTL